MIPLFKILRSAVESFHACLRSPTHPIGSCKITIASLAKERDFYTIIPLVWLIIAYRTRYITLFIKISGHLNRHPSDAMTFGRLDPLPLGLKKPGSTYLISGLVLFGLLTNGPWNFISHKFRVLLLVI